MFLVVLYAPRQHGVYGIVNFFISLLALEAFFAFPLGWAAKSLFASMAEALSARADAGWEKKKASDSVQRVNAGENFCANAAVRYIFYDASGTVTLDTTDDAEAERIRSELAERGNSPD
ncbi:MAG: hypothetical protein J6I40_00970 [Mailhella sp.]|nr:hypothetical protein [Mailhella sp.]